MSIICPHVTNEKTNNKMAVSKNRLKGWFNIFDLRFGSIARSFTLIVVSNLIKNKYNKINQEREVSRRDTSWVENDH